MDTSHSDAEIDNDDIAVLLDALKAWEQKDTAGQILGELFGAMVAGDDPMARLELEAKRAKDRSEREQAKRVREETSTLLRAKLITIRKRRNVESLIADGLDRR